MSCRENECKLYSIVEAGANLPPPYGFTRNIKLNLDNLDWLRKRYNNTGIYITAYRSKTGDFRNDELYSDLYFDFDKEGDFEAVREDALFTLSWLKGSFGIPYEVPNIYFSGNKGVHIIVDAEYLGIKPTKGLNRLFKLIASDIKDLLKNKTLDTAIYDCVRLFRVTNSIHQKTNLYKIPLSYEDLKSASYEEILEMAQKEREEIVKPITANNLKAKTLITCYVTKFTQKEREREEKLNRRQGKPIKMEGSPPCMEYILKKGAEMAGRNETCMVLASFFQQSGMDEASALDKAIEWNNEVLYDPMEIDEVERCVAQVFSNNYTYGCSKIKEVAQCDKKKCSLFKPSPEEPVVVHEDEIIYVDDIGSEEDSVSENHIIYNGSTLHDYELEMLDIINDVEQFNWNRDKLGGFTFGDSDLDEAFNGLQPALYLIAGQPNIGKSMLCLRLAWNVALLNKDKVYVIYFAIDDPDIAILPRIVAMEKEIPINVVKIPKKYEDDKIFMEKRGEGLVKLRDSVSSFKLLDKKYGYTIEAIKKTVREHQAKIEAAGSDKQIVVFIDNLYDVEVEEPISDTQLKLQKIANELDDLCEIQKIPVVCTGELKKINGPRRPIMDDLRETVKLQFVASAIMLCYNEVQIKGERSEVYHMIPEKEERQPILEVHVAKNKLGEYHGRLFYNMYPGCSLLKPTPKALVKQLIAQID